MQNCKKGIALLFCLFLCFKATALKFDATLFNDDDDGNATSISRNLRSQTFDNNNFNDGYRSDAFQFISIGFYCKRGQSHTFALGPCSSMYIQCSAHGSYAFEECPLEQIFNGEACIPAFKIRECLDPRINGLNLATEKLASASEACNNGPGIQISTKDSCSRQALLCDAFRESHAISCPSGQILDSGTFQCRPAPPACQWAPPLIKDSLLRDYCKYRPISPPPASSYYPYSNGNEPTSQKCQNWFVSCRDNEFIFCDGGQIYDKASNGCRPPLPQERCLTSDLCRGWEWRAVALGECVPQFRYCEGLKPRIFTCREDHVFQDKACVPSKFARGCPECKQGETKPAKHCRQYFECQTYGPELWALKTCPQNEFYNRESRRCEQIRGSACANFQQTCRDGDSYNPSCGDYLLCREGQFHPGKCPHLTRWSKQHHQCIPDDTCRRYDNYNECRPGDIIPTVDCETYFSCDPSKGQFVKRSCKESLYGKNPACDQCNSDKPTQPTSPYAPTSYTSVKCNHGEKIVDKIDCSRYIACIHGEWYSLQCEENTVFDSISGLCISSSKSRCPRNGSHLDSFHQPPDFGSSPGFGGDNSGFPPAPPPPPPIMDESRREMYESNGFLVCIHDSPRFVADPRDCGSYLECENGFYLPRTCPPQHNFDAFSGRCSSSFRCNKICEDGQRIPRKECGKALECQNNQWNPMKCKNNVMFINGRCSDIPCPDHGNPSTCFEGAIYSNERDCTRYVICRNGQLIEKQCSNGQKFDPDTLTCSYEYTCSDETSPHCYNGERKAIRDSCSHFEECRYGTFVKKSCPYGKSFNSITKKCQPGQCQGGSNIGEECTESPGLDGFLPDPLDCQRFYQCASGRWVPKTCGPGTAFSPNLGVCDHIRNVPSCARS